MDYHRIYAEFIKDRRIREPALTGYVERHHIVPRCMGGGNEVDNIIRLTAGDHFFAHLMLAKMHGGKLWYAVHALSNGAKIGKRVADPAFVLRARRYYASIKEGYGRMHSARMKGRFKGAAHPMFGKPCSPIALEKLKQRLADGFCPMASADARAKISAALTGRAMSPEWRERIAASRRGKKLSDETRAAISRGHTGLKRSAEAVAKQAAAVRGRPKPPEAVEKMRAALTGRKLSAEHAAKCAAHLAGCSKFAGRQHSEQTKARMSAVNKAKRVYAERFGCDPRRVNIQQMRDAGIAI